jgi:outer membrane lipoprotein LolB
MLKADPLLNFRRKTVRYSLARYPSIFGIILVLALGTLGGCAKQPGKARLHTPSESELAAWKVKEQKIAALRNYEAVGKVSFTNGAKGGSANVRWQQQQQNYTIVIQGPIGGGGVRIVGQPGMVSLMKSDGAVAVHKTPEGLMKENLGYEIPISGMLYWVKGATAPGTPPTKIQFDQNHHLALLEQHGWTIEYQGYLEQRGYDLPQTITLQSGSIKVKLILKEWHI